MPPTESSPAADPGPAADTGRLADSTRPAEPGESGSPDAVLYRKGQVRSPVSPFATALLVQNGQIAWVGTEEAAQDMARAATIVVDLADAWVAPGFVDAEVDAEGSVGGGSIGAAPRAAGVPEPADGAGTPGRLLDEAGRLGIVALHAIAGPGPAASAALADLLRAAAQRPGPTVTPYPSDVRPDAGAGDSGLVLPVAAGSRGAVTAALLAASISGRQVAFMLEDDGAIGDLIGGFQAAAGQLGQAALVAGGHRVHGADRCPDDALSTLVDSGTAIVLRPALATGGQRYGGLAAAGLPLAVSGAASSGRLDPWGALRAVTGLSARAAFSAATRGGYRAARAGGDGSGELAPGTPATFVVWALSGELVVEAPDDRVARWSTDPRAGVAGLPDLSQPDPRALRTVIRGRVVYDAHELTVTTRRARTQHAHRKHNGRT